MINQILFCFSCKWRDLKYWVCIQTLYVVVIKWLGQLGTLTSPRSKKFFCDSPLVTRVSSPSPVFDTRLNGPLTFFSARSPGSRNICPQDLYLLQESMGRHNTWKLSSLFPHRWQSFCSTSPSLCKWLLRALKEANANLFIVNSPVTLFGRECVISCLNHRQPLVAF